MFKAGDVVILLEQDINVYTVGEINRVYSSFKKSYDVYLFYSNHYYNLVPYNDVYHAPECRLRLATIRDIVNIRKNSLASR